MLSKILNKIRTGKQIKTTKLKLFFTLAIVLITLKLFIFQDFEFLYKRPLFVLQSTCECKKWEKIIVEENSNSERDYSGNR